MNKGNNFNQAEVEVNKRSRHNMGNEHITTASWGSLIPIYCQTLVPGDTVYYDPTIFIRTPAAQTATFGQVRVTQASFFVPTRLLWTEWTDFITGGLNSREIFTKPYVLFQDLMYLSYLEGPDRKPLQLLDSDMDNTLQTVGTSMGLSYFPFFSYGYSTDLITNFGLNPYSGVSHNPIVDKTNIYASSIQMQRIDVLPFRAYQKIWWDWFRDSVLLPESLKDDYQIDNGLYQDFQWDMLSHATQPTDITSWHNVIYRILSQFQTRKIAYRKDYFTTAKTDPQVGSAALVPVDLPNTDLNPSLGSAYQRLVGKDSSGNIGLVNSLNGNYPASFHSSPTSVIGQFQIEVFRTMNALQRYTEKNMIVGTRPVNLFLARYGYAPSAERYDMAELVGGDDRYLDWVQVTSTADTSVGQEGAALADVSSYGRLFFDVKKQTYTAHEHGFFISVLAIQPVVGYCDGIDKMWQLFEKEDYYTEEYESNGFEAIAKKELFAPAFGTSIVGGDDYGETPNMGANYNFDEAFGFQERYAAWKWHRDVLGGDFVRYSTSLGGDAFHTFRRFGQVPALNPAFVDVTTKQYGNNWNRLFVDTNIDYNPFYLDINNNNNMVRPMTGFAEPTLSNIIDGDGRSLKIPYGGVRL